MENCTSPRIVRAARTHGSPWLITAGCGDLIEEIRLFLDWKMSCGCTPTTCREYAERLLWLVQYAARIETTVIDLSSTDIAACLGWLHLQQSLSAQRIHLIRSTITDFYRFLVRRGSLDASPTALLPSRTGNAGTSSIRQSRALSDQEFEVFRAAIFNGDTPSPKKPVLFRDYAIVCTMYASGIRLGELAGMHINDLQPEGIWVRFRADNVNGARAKNGDGRARFVLLPRPISRLLQLYLEEVWVRGRAATTYLWINLGTGQPLSLSAIQQRFSYYADKSGIVVHPHMLRHTHATALARQDIAAGRPINWKFIQGRLGHKSVITTMKTYVHLSNDDHWRQFEQYQQNLEEFRAD
jgi:integrase